jgi:hypothetical protein
MIVFTDYDGRPTAGIPGSDSGEAINGIAQAGTWWAVSTRVDLNFRPLPGTAGADEYRVEVPYGAHDIASTPSGYFIAPLGRNGILLARPPIPREQQMTSHSAEEAGLYAYRLASLRSRAGVEVLACAGRLGGLFAGELGGDATAIRLKQAAKGIDVVDVCPLDRTAELLALAAVGRDGTLVLFQDILNSTPIAMKFNSVQGVAYRLLSSHGDVYLFTSKGMYVLGELAGRFLRGELAGGVTTPINVSPMEVVAANLVDNRWLLVTVPDKFIRLDAEAIHREVLVHLEDATIREAPTTKAISEWEAREVHTMTQLQLV